LAITNFGNFGNGSVPLPQPEPEHQPERKIVLQKKDLTLFVPCSGSSQLIGE
jgi:hypothetical protein